MSKYETIKNRIEYKIEILPSCIRYSIKGETIDVIAIKYYCTNDIVHIRTKNISKFTEKTSCVYNAIRNKVVNAIF